MFGTRWQRVQSYATIGAWHNAAILDDDEFTFGDLPETAYAAGMLGLIWSPQIALAIGMSGTPLNILEGAALLGLGASFAIGGSEGAGQYIDYITNPEDIHKSPEKVDALIHANRIVQALISFGASEVTRAGVDVLSDYKDEIFRSRWLTGPALPF
jgi:hypothetical protein